jgi:hypothetical protein
MEQVKIANQRTIRIHLQVAEDIKTKFRSNEHNSDKCIKKCLLKDSKSHVRFRYKPLANKRPWHLSPPPPKKEKALSLINTHSFSLFVTHKTTRAPAEWASSCTGRYRKCLLGSVGYLA